MMPSPTEDLTDKQYQILLGLYNELNGEFWRLSTYTIALFFNRLYGVQLVRRKPNE